MKAQINAQAGAVATIEYLYGTYTAEDGDGYVRTRVIPFRVVKKTTKRIFYVSDWIHHTTDRLGSVDRQQLEAAGEIYRRSKGYWDADFHLSVTPPELETSRVDPSALKAELARLRVEMANVHPDRGGDHDVFIAAHKRYESARENFQKLIQE